MTLCFDCRRSMSCSTASQGWICLGRGAKAPRESASTTGNYLLFLMYFVIVYIMHSCYKLVGENEIVLDWDFSSKVPTIKSLLWLLFCFVFYKAAWLLMKECQLQDVTRPSEAPGECPTITQEKAPPTTRASCTVALSEGFLHIEWIRKTSQHRTLEDPESLAAGQWKVTKV